jgi:hypothetical protein
MTPLARRHRTTAAPCCSSSARRRAEPYRGRAPRSPAQLGPLPAAAAQEFRVPRRRHFRGRSMSPDARPSPDETREPSTKSAGAVHRLSPRSPRRRPRHGGRARAPRGAHAPPTKPASRPWTLRDHKGRRGRRSDHAPSRRRSRGRMHPDAARSKSDLRRQEPPAPPARECDSRREHGRHLLALHDLAAAALR